MMYIPEVKKYLIYCRSNSHTQSRMWGINVNKIQCLLSQKLYSNTFMSVFIWNGCALLISCHNF